MGNTPKRTNWRLIIYLILIGLIVWFVYSRWGDYALTSSAEPAGMTEDYLIEYRLYRERTTSEQMGMLKTVIDDKEVPKDIRDLAYSQYLTLVDALGKETRIEGLVRAKGWECVAFLSGDGCTVAVRADTLDEQAVSQVADAVRKTTKLDLGKITVFRCR